MRNKKGYFFSLDAFIALAVILAVIIFIKPPVKEINYQENIQADLLDTLSNLQIKDLNNTYAENLRNNNEITEGNQTVLEQIGEFYAKGDDAHAEGLADSVIDYVNINKNIGLFFNNDTISVHANLSYNNSDTIYTSRQIISGIQDAGTARGYSSRAFLSSENKVDYFYFGGYIGDGNITVRIDGDLVGANIEGMFSKDFAVWVNDNYVDTYYPTANVPFNVSLADYTGFFINGANNISFKSQNNLYVAGGHIRVVYNESSVPTNTGKHYFPGVEGLLNIYDSFYVPGTLNDMEVFLHYNSSYNVFMTIGNKQIYLGNSSGAEETVLIDNAQLAMNFSYNDLSNETIPIRIGLENASYTYNVTLDADVFSVTDLSGSMRLTCAGASFFCCVWAGGCNDVATCEGCGGTVTSNKIGEAKNANDVFINYVLNYTGNRVGLIPYSTSVNLGASHDLSINNYSLHNTVGNWSAGGSTCICCGINEAINRLVAQSPSDHFRSIVVMSDGQATTGCGMDPVADYDADGDTTNDPDDHAIQAACNAYNNYGIRVYAVGFGDDVNETIMQGIGINCGQGGYFKGNVNQLVEIYEQIAQEIISASYYEQTVVAEGLHTQLFPDSYISIGYDRDIPYGMRIISETDIFNNSESQGSFYIPDDSKPYEAKVISYSGPKWTSRVQINNSNVWESVFELADYNSSFINLGDPYVVNIPLNKIFYGNNSARVFIGLNNENYSAGSQYNKIIYSIVKNISSYSDIVPLASGCTWLIQFEDGTNTTMNLPTNYTGSNNCFFTSENQSYNDQDAIDSAIYLLLDELDLNGNNKIESEFSEYDLTIKSVEVEGIPFTWETEVEVRVWR